jgi:hypothetical protein
MPTLIALVVSFVAGLVPYELLGDDLGAVPGFVVSTAVASVAYWWTRRTLRRMRGDD